MDFLELQKNYNQKTGITEIFPNFIVKKSKDLLIKGGRFYAIWDEENQIWSTDIYRLVQMIDDELAEYAQAYNSGAAQDANVKYIRSFGNGLWEKLNRYLNSLDDTNIILDNDLTFLHDDVDREDHRSKRLPYDICKGDYGAWEELVGTLYTPVEKRKIEWAIGSVLTGDSKRIQKFLVLYGEAGTGKSTVLRIIEDLFTGYVKTFEAKELGKQNGIFSTAAFATNPLVAIQHDGDLSHIEDNTKLNSIIAHEPIIINEKFKNQYTMSVQSFLFMGTNNPVKITNSKSGIIRRLIDVHPTGRKVPSNRYLELMSTMKFQLGAIANHCLDVYNTLGEHFYDQYRPLDMMYRTDTFFNFVEEHYFDFKKADYCTLKQAWTMYKDYCNEAKLGYVLSLNAFREELKSYFREFLNMTRIDGKQTRSVYRGFLADKFDQNYKDQDFTDENTPVKRLVLDRTKSIFDKQCAKCLAQYANDNGMPSKKWSEVDTKLRDISTEKLHYVQLPDDHIVIDFDLKNEKGEKDASRNLEAAAKWPPTYAEFSKSGAGVHLHYIYDGDSAMLSRLYDTGVEIKVFTGNSSLRRQLTYCNDLEIAHISSGLPLKEAKSVVNFDAVLEEKAIRTLIEKNLRKEYHAGTKPSIDFIYTILNEQYEKGAHYDVSDLKQKVLTFAMHSTNHAGYCVKMVNKMKFKSDEPSEAVEAPKEDPIVFFDVEVFPNLFLVNYKIEGEGHPVVRMINPSPQDMEKLMQMKLVGFNNRRYDNHIVYARYLGYDNQELYEYSQKIINAKKGSNVFFQEAYGISYTDIYDFASAPNKKSLKLWEVELGIHHQELGLPWDQPVPEDMWTKVAEYCDNDVISTEAVFKHLHGDWTARLILAKLTGLTPNHTTNQLSAKFIFGDEKHPGLIFTDLKTGKQYMPGEKGPYD